MAYNEALTTRLREALDAFSEADGVKRKIEEKKMFRGVTFMVNGKMCMSVGDDEFMFRIDPDRHEEVIEKDGVRPVVM